MGIGAYLKKISLPSHFGNTLPTTKNSSSVVANQAASQLINTLPSSVFLTTGTPIWRNLSELIFLLKCYYENPIVQTIINIKAEAFANIKFKVKDLKTGEIIPLSEYDSDGGTLNKLLKKPNPLQSTYEWLKQMKVNYEVFGNAYVYGSIPVGWENNFTYEDISVLNNIPPYCMAPVLTGSWLDATTKEEIIKNYVFTGFNGAKRTINTNAILHLNDINIKFDQNFTSGQSNLLALKKPISNIDFAFESRNVMIRKRGALGAWTSEKKDEAMGNLPLNDNELEEVQKAFKKYGLLDDQYQQIISPMPLKWQQTVMDVKKLMLFEEIESDAIAIANALGVPELLVKYYVKGGTFENLDASEKRLYDSTIIPESVDFMVGINNFLKTEDAGIMLIGDYDHLHILQINKKEEAETYKIKEESALSAFKIGAITYNDYLKAINMPSNDTIGELHIWDLTDMQLNALGIHNTRGNENNI